MNSGSKEQRRIFVGGLKPGVTNEDLHEKFSRFGEVTQIEIKTRNNETDNKAFAYINLTTDENGFKKCFTAYSNTKWKGGQLKLQFAKESFLEKLKQEQQEAKAAESPKSKPAAISPALKEVNVKAVPGTPMDEQGNWVIGKYSRVLPVLHLKKANSKKLVTLDPSKTTHALKKLKSDDMVTDLDPSKLTWTLEEKDDDLSRKRQGIFPERQNTKKKKSNASAILHHLHQIISEHGDNTELEVVPLGKSLSKLPDASCKARGYDSDSSVHSADTDEILTASTATTHVKITSRSSVRVSSNSLSKVSNETSTETAKISKPLVTPKTTGKTDKAQEKNKSPTPKDKSQTPKNSTKKEKSPVSTKASANMKATPKNSGKIDMSTDKERDQKLAVSAKKSSLRARTDSSCGMTSGSSEAGKPASGGNSKQTSEATSEEVDKTKVVLHPEPQFTFVKATAQGKCFRVAASLSKTQPFRGLSSLLDNHNVCKNEGETELRQEAELRQANSAAPSVASRTDLFCAKSQSKGRSVVIAKLTSPDPENEAIDTSPAKPFASVADKAASISTNAKTVSKQAVPLKPHHSSTATCQSSPPARQSPRKRTRQDAGGDDDSDLDDNDFEKVCKKLAARDEKSGGGPVASGSRTAASYQAVKDMSGDSHLAWKTNKEALLKQEKLVTKAIREGTSTKHVKFSNSDEEDGERTFQEQTAPAKLALFDSDESETEEAHPEFAVRPQFHGEKGHKLLELQSKIKDKRFHIDERFQESEEEPEKIPDKNELTQEKERNLRILEKILGYKPRARRTSKIIDMNQIRYDPKKNTSRELHRSKLDDGAVICKDDQSKETYKESINDKTVTLTGDDKESGREESAEESGDDDINGIDEETEEDGDETDSDNTDEDNNKMDACTVDSCKIEEEDGDDESEDGDDDSESVEDGDGDSESVEDGDDDSESGKENGKGDAGNVDSSSDDKREKENESDCNNESNNDDANESDKYLAKAKKECESKDNKGTVKMKKKIKVKKNVDGNVKGDKSAAVPEKDDKTNAASLSLGNFFAGGETFNLFDDPSFSGSKSPSGLDNLLPQGIETVAKIQDEGESKAGKKVKEEAQNKDVGSKGMEAEDRDNNAKCMERDASKLSLTVMANRKLEAKPHFCITQDSILIGKAGQIPERDRDYTVNYTEIRKEFQYLVRELHKRALRKQKQQISEKNKKRNKFTGSTKKKTNFFR